MKKKTVKHPAKMTTEEAVKHLFHPRVVARVKKGAREAEKPSKPKRP